ncbi:MAG: CAP domain-containing protein [Myxococcota bacterium]
MPRTPAQGLGFLIGMWIALWLSPFGASADGFTQLEAGLHDGVNQVRQGRHLIPLERRADLDAVARAHSRDMAKRGFFAHENPEGENPLHRIERGAARGFALAAENIGVTDRGEPNREILHAWIASEIHRNNLYSPAFNATGIGIARAPNGSLIYTQVYVTYPR